MLISHVSACFIGQNVCTFYSAYCSHIWMLFSILGNIRDLQHVISYYLYESVLDFLHESALRLRVMNETYTA